MAVLWNEGQAGHVALPLVGFNALPGAIDGLPTLEARHWRSLDGPLTTPITWGTGMSLTQHPWTHARQPWQGTLIDNLAERIESHIEHKACGRIRDLHVVCSEDMIILQGRSRTYHAKQLAQEAVLDLTDGHHLLANQIVVC